MLRRIQTGRYDHSFCFDGNIISEFRSYSRRTSEIAWRRGLVTWSFSNSNFVMLTDAGRDLIRREGRLDG
jgi:hypothetical protein